MALITLGHLLLAAASQLVVPLSKGVTAAVETDPVASRDDAADEPAVWVHPTQPSLSTNRQKDRQLGSLID
jgi:3-phytase